MKAVEKLVSLLLASGRKVPFHRAAPSVSAPHEEGDEPTFQTLVFSLAGVENANFVAVFQHVTGG
jgi:hypothetical protein